MVIMNILGSYEDSLCLHNLDMGRGMGMGRGATYHAFITWILPFSNPTRCKQEEKYGFSLKDYLTHDI